MSVDDDCERMKPGTGTTKFQLLLVLSVEAFKTRTGVNGEILLGKHRADKIRLLLNKTFVVSRAFGGKEYILVVNVRGSCHEGIALWEKFFLGRFAVILMRKLGEG